MFDEHLNLIQRIENLEKSLERTILYSNLDGSNETVTLSQAITDFSDIEIYYKNSDGQHGSIRVEAVEGLETFGTIVRKNSQNTCIMINSALFKVNTSTINISRNSQANIYFNGTSNSDINQLYITKVIGIN